MKPIFPSKVIVSGLFVGLLGPLSLGAAQAADIIFETNGDNTIGEYTTSGDTVNNALVSGLQTPGAIAVSGPDLFVANFVGAGGVRSANTPPRGRR
jgi:hypothetical protein